jgi:hypothetical protein
MVFPPIFTQMKQLPLPDQLLWGTTKISKANKNMNLRNQANDLNSYEMKIALYYVSTLQALLLGDATP